LPEIEKNTKGDIVDTLQSDFSTTGVVEKMISTACVMDSFKKYFSYGRCIPCCGIRNACFLGTAEDWERLLAKTDKLKMYDIDSIFTSYIEGVQEVLKKMIETYHGEVDVHWWNQVMHIEYESIGSGGDYVEWVDGWILKLFGKKKCDAERLGNNSIDVPVKINNLLTGEMKTVHLVGGFGGVHAMPVDGRRALRPQTSMIVYHDPTSQEDKDAAERHFQQ